MQKAFKMSVYRRIFLVVGLVTLITPIFTLARIAADIWSIELVSLPAVTVELNDQIFSSIKEWVLDRWITPDPPEWVRHVISLYLFVGGLTHRTFTGAVGRHGGRSPIWAFISNTLLWPVFIVVNYLRARIYEERDMKWLQDSFDKKGYGRWDAAVIEKEVTERVAKTRRNFIWLPIIFAIGYVIAAGLILIANHYLALAKVPYI